MKKCASFFFPALLAPLFGVMLTLAFAPYDIFPFAFLAPAALLALWLPVSTPRAFWLGFLFGLGFFASGVYWVYIAIHQYGQVPPALAALITLGLIAILALFPAMTGYLLKRFFPFNQSTTLLCAFPAIWVFLEWVRSFLFTGFPWLFLGYSQIHSPLKGLAPILGVYGVSLAVIMTSALIVNAYLRYQQKLYSAAYFNLLAIFLIWAASFAFTFIPWTSATQAPISVSLVQGNIPQSIKWSSTSLDLSFERYQHLTEPLWQKSQLIIWPEAAIPLPLQQAAPFINEMDRQAKQHGVHLILGIPIKAADSESYHNALAVLGERTGNPIYLKRRLVPFGEYTPLLEMTSHWLSLKKMLQFMDIPLPNTLPGTLDQPALQVGDLKILASICYEIAFPELMRSRDPHIALILTVTNDAWFGHSSAQAQHIQMAQMRALEMGRPLLFVSNDGITAIINADGSVQAALAPYQASVLSGSVQTMQGLTPWMNNGADPLRFILICLLVAAIRSNSNWAAKEKIQKNTLLPDLP